MENTTMTDTEIKLWAMKYAKEFCGKSDLLEFSKEIYQWLKDDKDSEFKIDMDKIIKEQIHAFGTKDLKGLVKSCIKVLLEKSKIDNGSKQ